MSNLWLGSSKEHPAGKKPAEEHPAVKPAYAAGVKHPSPTVNPPTMKKPAATREEHPPLTVNACSYYEGTSDAGKGHSAVKQPAEAVGKKLAEEHPVGIEERHAKQSAASGH
ncbi:hypothetical protein B296_00033058 [Ensete ventricosum]|uniref:Uncharacterized protein n=1 Tax=Ensete ventricosum TaxID=4639 RepID=A0A426X5M7_ENSVE|nr:hypothetical protein B296_00033058 [Ensete ventricosum]